MKKAVHTEKAPKPVGPYSQGIRAGDLLFLSGQVAIDPSTGKLSSGSAGEQTSVIMENLRAILQAEALDFSDVVKTTIFLTDMADFSEVNRIYGGFFNSNPPARSTLQVAGLPLGARLEIEMIACCKF
ncbi:MAG: reactive intermediate/imine deaminase [Deltaproteobacteria bacterium HGW-Deltaproteobacteria-21]|nr:MAG: reactive intermediate/imine deaminase [Deltaproteobacteria bacterium HGW-Deltaproteobacteria-21]